MPKTIPSELRQLINEGFELIELHRYDYVDQHGRERGKSPVDAKWVSKSLPTNYAKKCVELMEKGSNIGVRLRRTDLVIDVDPRAFPDGETLKDKDNPWTRFCSDTGLDFSTCPTVQTGSGGLHVYMTKPEDVSIKDSVPEYKGVEFKSFGRQVVAPGSIHPTTKKPYEWVLFQDDLSERYEVPKKLLNIIRRPVGSRQTSGGGEYDQEQIAELLDDLDPEDFSQHEDWFQLMQSVHHASAGDARAEFIEWSTRDHEYAGQENAIGIRWDSLHRKPDGPAVTYKTFHKILTEHGKSKGQVISKVALREDFNDDFDLSDPEVYKRVVDGDDAELTGTELLNNGRHHVVQHGSQVRVARLIEDKASGRPYWTFTSVQGFKEYYAYLKEVEVLKGGKTVVVPCAEAWLKSERRGREFTKSQVLFNPEKEYDDVLNLWTGWGVDPVKKDSGWSHLDRLIFEGLCDGDRELYEYVLNWCAMMFQHPARPGQTAICFQGDKGTGKSTLGKTLAKISGRHGLVIAQSGQLTGRFNSHLSDAVFLFSDEAVNPYDRDAEGQLKALITEPMLTYERKGVDAIPGKNYLHVMLASNDDWIVNATDDERRYFVSKVSNVFQRNASFFKKLYEQLENGGYEAFLWDMLQRDLGNWDPQTNLPVTKALIEQKFNNMTLLEQWWYSVLDIGELPCEPAPHKKYANDWNNEVLQFEQEFKDAFKQWCKQEGKKIGTGGTASNEVFWKKMAEMVELPVSSAAGQPANRITVQAVVPEEREYTVKANRSNGRARAVVLPSLDKCREDFAQRFGFDKGKFEITEKEPVDPGF